MKPLDLADKYPPAEDFDDEEITIKVQVPTFEPKVVVDTQPEFDLWGERDTIPSPPPYPHPHMKREVNWGAVGVLLATFAFWATVGYFIFR